jgi:hypothetical protein
MPLWIDRSHPRRRRVETFEQPDVPRHSRHEEYGPKMIDFGKSTRRVVAMVWQSRSRFATYGAEGVGVGW